MFDVHCHIIPGIDDGAQNLEESLDIIRSEVDAGTEGFVATPHVYTEDDLWAAEQIVERTTALREAVAQAGIQVQIVPGAEVYPGMNILKAIDAGMPLTVDGRGRHMLVDLPMSSLPMDFSTMVFELQTRGITPIIAHPERCGTFQADPEALRPFLEKGCACQINAGSVRGKYGPRAQEVAFFYLDRHLAHFMASDAHNARHGGILRRGVESIESRLSPEYVQIISQESGRCILAGEALPTLPAPPEPTETRSGWLQRLFKK